MRISKCRDEDKVTFVAHSFMSEALCWWDNFTLAMGDRAVKRSTWEKLKQLVIEQFCPTHELDKLDWKFVNLEAGNLPTKNTHLNLMNWLACSRI